MITKEGIFIFLCVVMLVFAGFGGYFVSLDESVSITTSIPTETPSLSAPTEGILDVFSLGSWAWNSFAVLMGFAAFTMEGTPYVLTYVSLFLWACWIFLLILIIRGN